MNEKNESSDEVLESVKKIPVMTIEETKALDLWVESAILFLRKFSEISEDDLLS